MKEEIKKIYVYENWNSEKPNYMGILISQFVRGEEIFSFEYDFDWLKNNKVLFLDPCLMFFEGKQYTKGEIKQFGIFMDSEPDRWGY